MGVMKPVKKGKFIVIDGNEGSGKTTQIELLRKRLENTGQKVLVVKYPRPDSESGKILVRYLAGEFGDISALSPQFISLLYAADRYDHFRVIQDHVKDGCIVLANRYSQANYAFQAAKLSDPKEQSAFMAWQQTVESRLPVPDEIVFLDMPFEANPTRSSISIPVPKNVHEMNATYEERVRVLYEKLCKRGKWLKIPCAKPISGSWNVYSRDAVSDMVWNALSKKFKWGK